MQFIGRKDATDELDRICELRRPQFVVVYGRRGVGKTCLVRQYFKNEFAFYATEVKVYAMVNSTQRCEGGRRCTYQSSSRWESTSGLCTS